MTTDRSSGRSDRSFRIVADPKKIPLVEALLHEQGYEFEPEPFAPLFCRRLTREPKPLGSSMAATFGYVYIQDRSSMLPPLALAPEAGARVLDMCSSPGSKTGLLAQLVGKDGFVLGNEPSSSRNATLRNNLADLNLVNTAVCSHPGEKLPMADASWDRILLDPPCSGWGTADKHPSVLKLWTEEKVMPLVNLQRDLLREAARLLAPGGRVAYSTCTTNVQENEEQVRFAANELGLEVVALEGFTNFTFKEPELTEAEGTLLVDGEQSDAQGFYIALLKKPGNPQPVAEHGELPAKAQDVDPEALETFENSGVDLDQLPDGEFFSFNDKFLFLHRAALDRLPVALRWQGFLAGRVGRGGVKLNPHMRVLLPENSAGGVDIQDVAELERLLTGQSLTLEKKPDLAGLYWRGLPLGWLTIKGSRALWSGK